MTKQVVTQVVSVGFGPETTANSFEQSGVKIAQRLNESGRFRAGTFSRSLEFDELSQFDVLVFIKHLPSFDTLAALKSAGKRLILDYQDMFLIPTAHERKPLKRWLKAVYYCLHERNERRRFALLDGCFTPSPEAERVVRAAGIRPLPLFRQIYNDWNESNFRQHTNATSGLRIVWTGVGLNIPQNAEIEPILEDIATRHQSHVVYLTAAEKTQSSFVEYRHWSLDTWERELAESDIAFRWWHDSNDQRHKDSNKIISYMAAGLPVVCKPTDSDQRVIEEGKTGYFAATPDEFREKVEILIQNPSVRKTVGEQAHKDVWSKYSLSRHVDEMKRHFDALVNLWETR